MGTNYYLESEACEKCGRGDEDLHIGKSSFGWVFSLHVIPEQGINSLEDWENKWESSRIFDEYGDEYEPDNMRYIITERRVQDRTESDFDYVSNHAEPGPNNLVRHVIDGSHCIGHGQGTWDLITGEFS